MAAVEVESPRLVYISNALQLAVSRRSISVTPGHIALDCPIPSGEMKRRMEKRQ
jgi:hypothetical protein